MNISFEGIGQWCATFAAGTVSEGAVVKMSDNAKVAVCDEGDDFCGVVCAIGGDKKACSVQLGGLVTVGYTGTTAPSVGY